MKKGRLLVMGEGPFHWHAGVVRPQSTDGGHEQLGFEGQQQFHLPDSRGACRGAIRRERPGASFGPTGLDWMLKGNPTAYCDSKWIKAISPNFIDFNVPSRPAMNYYIDFSGTGAAAPYALARPAHPARGCAKDGDLLARLSPQQIRDAFRAGGYSTDEVEQLSRVVERRIGELKKL